MPYAIAFASVLSVFLIDFAFCNIFLNFFFLNVLFSFLSLLIELETLLKFNEMI